MLFKNILPILATFLASPFLVTAFPNGAGTCDVNAMAAGSHGASAQPNNGGADGYTITTAMNGASYDITLNGPKPIKGLLIYVVNAKGDRIGDFKIPTGLQQKQCNGTGVNTLTHKDSTLKTLPMKLSYSSGGVKTGQWKVMSLVVQDFKDWNKLDDTTFDLATGKVVSGGANGTTGTNGTTTGTNSTSSTSNSTSSSTDTSSSPTSTDTSGTSGTSDSSSSNSSSSGSGYGTSGASHQADISFTVYAYSTIVALVFLMQTMNRL